MRPDRKPAVLKYFSINQMPFYSLPYLNEPTECYVTHKEKMLKPGVAAAAACLRRGHEKMERTGHRFLFSLLCRIHPPSIRRYMHHSSVVTIFTSTQKMRFFSNTGSKPGSEKTDAHTCNAIYFQHVGWEAWRGVVLDKNYQASLSHRNTKPVAAR